MTKLNGIMAPRFTRGDKARRIKRVGNVRIIPGAPETVAMVERVVVQVLGEACIRLVVWSGAAFVFGYWLTK